MTEPAVNQAREASDVDDVDGDAPDVELSLEAIEARMAELGHSEDAGDDDGDAKVDAKAKPPKADGDDNDKDKDEGEGEKKDDDKDDDADADKDAEDEEKKSWQAKMKAEVHARDTKIAGLEQAVTRAAEKDRQWMQAANETLVELQSVAAERDYYANLLAASGIQLDPRDAEILRLRQENARAQSGAGLQQQLAEQQQRQQMFAAAEALKNQTVTEVQAVIAKYPEMKDATVAEDILSMWSAAASAAERKGKEPPAMAAFVKKQIAALRYEKAAPKIQAGRAQRDQRGRAPRTLQSNRSSAVPTKFEATDEGIEAWAKSRGYSD